MPLPSQIVPKDFDLSPNFEIVKYNIIGLGTFNYQSIWAEKIPTFHWDYSLPPIGERC